MRLTIFTDTRGCFVVTGPRDAIRIATPEEFGKLDDAALTTRALAFYLFDTLPPALKKEIH